MVLLIVLVLGASALTVLSIGNLRKAGDVAVSSQALYAADTGAERGMTDYRWSDANTPLCTTADDVPVGNRASYQLTVRGDDGSCPTFQDLQNGVRALCVEAIGKARSGTVRRRVTNDAYDPLRFTNPCQR